MLLFLEGMKLCGRRAFQCNSMRAFQCLQGVRFSVFKDANLPNLKFYRTFFFALEARTIHLYAPITDFVFEIMELERLKYGIRFVMCFFVFFVALYALIIHLQAAITDLFLK